MHKLWYHILLRREASWNFGCSSSTFMNKPIPRKPFFPQSGPKSNPSNPSGNSSHTLTPQPKPSGERKGQKPLSQSICNYSKQSGHITECLTLKRKGEKHKSPKPTGLNTLRSKLQSCVKDQSKKISNDQELIQSDPISCPQTKREITKYINWQQFMKGTLGKPNEQFFLDRWPFSCLNLTKICHWHNR